MEGASGVLHEHRLGFPIPKEVCRTSSVSPTNPLLCRYAIMIIDGMTKWASNTPHFPRDPMNFDRGDQLVMPITGVIYTCGTSQSYIYTDLDMFSKGANATCNAIIRTLLDQPEEERPEILHLQLDNYAAENKCAGFYAFLAALVAIGLVEEIRVNYLIVGHTHENIDAMFGHIRDMLAANTALTPTEMIKLWAKSVTPSPKVIPAFTMYDYLAWVDPYAWKTLNGISKPHAVEFKKAREGVCSTHFPCCCR